MPFNRLYNAVIKSILFPFPRVLPMKYEQFNV